MDFQFDQFGHGQPFDGIVPQSQPHQCRPQSIQIIRRNAVAASCGLAKNDLVEMLELLWEE